jgi:hypothetical protein
MRPAVTISGAPSASVFSLNSVMGSPLTLTPTPVSATAVIVPSASSSRRPALLEPVQTGQRQPAVVGGQSIEALAAPLLDLSCVLRIDRHRRLGAGDQAEQQGDET